MDHKKILVIGADSSISTAVIALLEKSKIAYVGTSRRSSYKNSSLYLDLSNTNTFEVLVSFKFSTVLLSASICSIDECDRNTDFTRQINVRNSFALVQLLKNTTPDLRVIMLSTDMVFDGSTEKPTQKSIKAPLNEYGKQKAELEDLLLDNYKNIKIIRFGKVLEENISLFNRWVGKLVSGEEITSFNDLFFSPISAEFAVAAIMRAIESKDSANEIFHASSDTDISYKDAALWFAKKLNASSKLVQEVSVHQAFPLKTIAKMVALGNNIQITGALKGVEALEIYLNKIKR